MQVSDFNYDLPAELIAQFPPEKRGQSRLLSAIESQYQDQFFSELPALLNPHDLLVLNNTEVMKARMYGKKASGGQVEILIERVTSDKTALAHIRASKAPKPGTLLVLANQWAVKVIDRLGELFILELESSGTIEEMLDTIGALPLPPYITHTPTKEDELRYQTVYAASPGAVAAPTAGLHFTESLLADLKGKGIQTAFLTLHVGAGTFQPVRVEHIDEHKMHQEYYHISAETQAKVIETKKAGGRVVAVGTTTLRALEASSQQGLFSQPKGDTNIFITPGFCFQVVDSLITNFHLPKSTLLMLVSAFFGYEETKALYQYAIKERYRFFSYGDAMILNRKV